MALCTIPTSFSLTENASENYLEWLKRPNEDFDNLNHFVITKKSGNETATVSSNVLTIDLPDADGEISLFDNVCVQTGDFNITLDIDDYQYDDATHGPYLVFRVRDETFSPTVEGDSFGIQMWYDGGGWSIKSERYKNGIGSSGAEHNPAGRPTKLKLIREGATMTVKFLYDGSWTQLDYNTYADWAGMGSLEIKLVDNANRGGSAQVSKMVANIDTFNIYWALTTGVTKATGTKIGGLTGYNYRHVTTPKIEYFYVITGENEDGESDDSDEISGTPTDVRDLYYDTELINAYDTAQIEDLYSVSAMPE